MSDHRQAEKPLAIGERRLHTRTPVTPQAFVKFGANNYGFVFNISENGLVFAPTGTLTLAVGSVAKMRFQLPDSKEWIETNGEVAWIAESQREAGVRFVDLIEETRAKIRNWISQEPVRPEIPEVRDAIRNAIGASQPPGAVPEDKILKSIFADPGLFLVGSKSARSKPAVQPPPPVANEASQVTSAAPVPERRSQPRRRVLSLEYLDLGDSNGGIILNLGEDGMYIQAVAGLSPDHVSKLSFKIPDSGYLVETSGNIVWVGESRKDAGIQFDNLPEEALLKIREWVAEEFPARQNSSKPPQPSDPAPFAPKPASDPRKDDRLVEMPPSVALKSPPKPSGFPVTRISDQKPDLVSKLPLVELVPPSTQNSKDASIDYVPPKQPESAAKAPLTNVPPLVATNVPAPANDQKNVAREVTAAASDLPDWPIAESLPASPVSDRINNPIGTASRIGSQAKGSSEIAPRASSSTTASETSAPTRSLNWKSIAAGILVVVLLSFAAGWIAAGPGGRKQILDKLASQQSDSSQPPENPGAASAQTDAPVPGAGLPQTDARKASSEQAVNPATPQPASQILPPSSTQPASTGSQVIHATAASPQLATQTPRPTNANVGTAASNAPEKLADTKRDIPTSNSSAPIATNSSPANATSPNKPSLAANAATPQTAVPRESRASQPNSNSSSQGPSPSSANDAGQPQTIQLNAAASSNPPSPVAKSVPPPVIASASVPAPAATEVVKATVSVNASPFPSIRVPPELKSQISKQGASLQIGQLISRLEPAYPEDAQHQRIEGVVKLRAIIGRDGSVQDLDQMSGPPLLVAAAANAVRQWRYKPTSLDGQPVEATESITVTFRLQPTRAN
jgi:TonB family protein